MRPRPSGNEIYIAQEIYLPVAIRGTGQYPWTDICGIQVTDNDGNNRWQTNPGFHIATGWYGAPGDNYLVVEWGSQAGDQRQRDELDTLAGRGVVRRRNIAGDGQLPVIRTGATIQAWINGQLVLTITGAITADATQTRAELYMNLYGDDSGGTLLPRSALLYRRNIRASYSRITSPP